MTEHFMTLENCRQHIGERFVSSWLQENQDRITAFGEAIDDPAPHHMDPAFAAEHSPWGKTIAFGWLTTSLTTPMVYEVFRYRMDGDPVTYGYPASYGLNRLRFIAPVLEGKRIRGLIELSDVDDKGPGRTVYTFQIEVEIEGESKPALVAEYLLMWLKDSPK